MTKISIISIIVALTLAGCVQHRWVPGPQVAGDFGRVSGQCKLAAIGGPPDGGFVGVAGSPKLVGAVVGASILISGIAAAVQRQDVYNACMESEGFVSEDTAP